MHSIAFEGLDGVGKTTMAESYAGHIAGVSVTSIALSPDWAQRRRQVNRSGDVEARFAYFLDLNAEQLANARRLGGMGIECTMDSSIYRTVATHRVLGSLAAQEYEIGADVRPDHTILLDLPEPERIRRLTQRDLGLVFSSSWDSMLHERQADLRDAFASFGLPSVSTLLDPAEIMPFVDRQNHVH